MAKFEIYTDNQGEFRFRLKGGNGKQILASGGYTSKTSCKNGIESVQMNSQDYEKYSKLKANNGKLHFNIKASNGQVIGSSQMYESVSGFRNGIASVKKHAPRVKIVELVIEDSKLMEV